MKGIVTLVVGPSGVGKSSNSDAKRSYRVADYTFRPVRESERYDLEGNYYSEESIEEIIEKEGKFVSPDGIFLSKEEFDKRISDEFFVWYETPDGRRYGFGQELKDALDNGENCSEQIVQFDPIEKIVDMFSDYKIIKKLFLSDLDELHKRLLFRGANNLDSREKQNRINLAKYLMNPDLFNEITINDPTEIKNIFEIKKVINSLIEEIETDMKLTIQYDGQDDEVRKIIWLYWKKEIDKHEVVKELESLEINSMFRNFPTLTESNAMNNFMYFGTGAILDEFRLPIFSSIILDRMGYVIESNNIMKELVEVCKNPYNEDTKTKRKLSNLFVKTDLVIRDLSDENNLVDYIDQNYRDEFIEWLDGRGEYSKELVKEKLEIYRVLDDDARKSHHPGFYQLEYMYYIMMKNLFDQFPKLGDKRLNAYHMHLMFDYNFVKIYPVCSMNHLASKMKEAQKFKKIYEKNIDQYEVEFPLSIIEDQLFLDNYTLLKSRLLNLNELSYHLNFFKKYSLDTSEEMESRILCNVAFQCEHMIKTGFKFILNQQIPEVYMDSVAFQYAYYMENVVEILESESNFPFITSANQLVEKYWIDEFEKASSYGAKCFISMNKIKDYIVSREDIFNKDTPDYKYCISSLERSMQFLIEK